MIPSSEPVKATAVAGPAATVTASLYASVGVEKVPSVAETSAAPDLRSVRITGARPLKKESVTGAPKAVPSAVAAAPFGAASAPPKVTAFAPE